MPIDGEKVGANIGKSLESFQKVIKDSGPAAAASYTLLASVLIFTFLGWYIDLKYEISPAGTLIGLMIGLITGFYHLAKTIWTKRK